MILTPLKKAKHTAYLLTKSGNRAARAARFVGLDAAARMATVIPRTRSYDFDRSRYRRSFLNRVAIEPGGPSES